MSAGDTVTVRHGARLYAGVVVAVWTDAKGTGRLNVKVGATWLHNVRRDSVVA
jgi:hypothetical protein